GRVDPAEIGARRPLPERRLRACEGGSDVVRELDRDEAAHAPSAGSRPEELRVRERQPERMATEPVERDLGGEELHPVARAPELVAARRRAAGGGDRDPQRPGRFLGGRAVGARDPGGGESEVRAEHAPCAGRHLRRRLLADRAVRVEGLLADAGQLARKETRASDGSTAPATISSSADSVSPKVWKMRDRYTSPPRSVRSHGSTVSSIMTFISRGTPGRTTR